MDSIRPVQIADVMSEAVELEHERMVDAALAERPSLSIRMRIILSYGLVFLLCAGVNAWVIYELSEIRQKTHFLEIANNYMSEIQQARRYEKNFLLYGTNLDDALTHIHDAESILSRNRSVISKIVGASYCQTMTEHIGEYESLLVDLGATAEPNRMQVEARLRIKGSEMVTYATDFVNTERESVDKLLRVSWQMPFVFLVVLAVLMILFALFLAKDLLGSLSRFMEYTRRIGQGDFSLITPTRKYQDEFSRLARAFNHMVRELDRRHRILTESHKLRAIGTLVAGVAHELNNPLNNTLLISTRYAEDHEDLDEEEKLEMIQDIISETERSQIIVRNLLDFARESEARSEHLEIKRIVESAVRLVGNQIKMAKVKLYIYLAKELPPVHGDAQMLIQVFVNLLINAAEVLEPGGQIEIRSYMSDEEEGYVAVDIKDEGPGIPPHILSQIFDPFFTTKKKGKGTGLGLSVSRGIVRKLGGYLRVKSAVGRGTTFTVLLPATNIPSSTIAGNRKAGSEE